MPAIKTLTQSQLTVLWIIWNTPMQISPWGSFSQGERRSVRVLRELGVLEYRGQHSPLVVLTDVGKEMARRLRLSRRRLWLGDR